MPRQRPDGKQKERRNRSLRSLLSKERVLQEMLRNGIQSEKGEAMQKVPKGENEW